jgi:outer membrane receptor protein involved in Fe transport
VIVTDTKRVESLQDVPISVAAVSAQKMTDFGITDMENLSAYVPNFTINQTGISTTITIRGVSSGVNPGFEQSVGMYNDGIFLRSRPTRPRAHDGPGTGGSVAWPPGYSVR